MKDEEVYAIIMAKGKSKRLPGKNLKELHGTPLVACAIEYALREGLKPIVFTENEEIERLALYYGALVRPQKEEQFEGYDAVAPVIGELGIGVMVGLQCTCPFHREGVLSEMLEMVQKGEAESVYTSEEVKMNGHLRGEYYRGISLNQEGTEVFHRYDGNLIVCTGEYFLRQGNYFLGQESRHVKNEYPYTWDIDTEMDLYTAQDLASRYGLLSYVDARKYLGYLDRMRKGHEEGATEMDVFFPDFGALCRYQLGRDGKLLMPCSAEVKFPIFYVQRREEGIFFCNSAEGNRYILEKENGEVWKATDQDKVDGGKTETVTCHHPKWKRQLSFSMGTRRGDVVNGNDQFTVLEYYPEKKLKLKWDNWGEEEFEYKGGVYIKVKR